MYRPHMATIVLIRYLGSPPKATKNYQSLFLKVSSEAEAEVAGGPPWAALGPEASGCFFGRNPGASPVFQTV